MFAEWTGAKVDDEMLRRRIWRRGDVALGFALLLLGLAVVIALSAVAAAVRGGASAGADLPEASITFAFEALLGVIVLLLAARRVVPWRQLGLWRLPRGDLVAGALGGAYGSIFVYGLAVALIGRLGVDVSRFDQGNPLPTGSSTGLATWVVLAVAVVVVAPVAEELFFRGFVFRATAGVLPVGASYLVSGLAFALFHLNPSVIVPFTFVGAFFAWAYWSSGSLWTSIVAHAIVNGVSFFLTVSGTIH